MAVQCSENVWGGDDGGSRLLQASEDEPQEFLSSYMKKVDEILAGRVISCSGD